VVDRAPIARHRLVPEEWALALAALALFAFGHRWARERTLPPAEQRAFEAINELPDHVRFGWWPPMQLGNALVWVVGPVTVLVATRRPRPALATFLATFGAWMGAKAVKRAVKRGRPEFFLAEAVRFREAAPTGLGFISGHAAVAFGLATVLRPYLPRTWALLLFATASTTGAGRMYFGAHLPADVISGAGFGIACGLAANALVGVDAGVR
jgi:undecaprenyl-diphosphatase